jgi:peptide/nickel transport system permease protein
MIKQGQVFSGLQLRIGMAILLIPLAVMLAVILFGEYSIQMDMSNRLQPSSLFHPLGTDTLGRDMVSCLVYGMGVSLAIASVVVVFTAIFGSFMGLVAGLSGGITDIIIMRIVDILSAFPGILPAMALAAFLSQGYWTLVLALSISGWVPYARIIRGEVLKIKQKEFILAARTYNASYFHVLRYHLLPLVLPLALVQASVGISGIILAESGLNFLGIGLEPEIPGLGQLMDAGRDYLFHDSRLIIAPGMVLFLMVIGFNFIGEGMKPTRGHEGI